VEKPPKSAQASSIEKLSLKEKFAVLLSVFGTEQARRNFIALCREYNTERVAQVVSQDDGENYRAKKSIVYSPPQRANLHNRIMETIGKLSVQSKKITPRQEAVLRDFHSREKVAEAVAAFILAESGLGGGDDLSEEGRKNMSDTAYFHSLGREH
jgi:hypothetical protein